MKLSSRRGKGDSSGRRRERKKEEAQVEEALEEVKVALILEFQDFKCHKCQICLKQWEWEEVQAALI